MSKRYYHPSGNLPTRVVIIALGASLALVPIAWLYARLNHFAPAGLPSVLYAIGFGGCCARATFLSAKWGKARNPGGMALIGAGIGLIGWYCQWAAWLSIASETPAVAALINDTGRTMIDFATAPGRMYVLAGQIRESRLIELKSPDFAWILEFFFVTALSALIGYGKAIAPFCETGGEWGETVELPRKHAFITDEKEFRKQMESDPRDTLDTLTSFPETADGFSSISIICCRPSGKAFLSIYNNAIAQKEGTEKAKKNLLFSNLSIDLALADDLIRQCATGGSLQPTPPSETNPPELQIAIGHLEAGNYEDALACAVPYLSADEALLCTEAVRLSALVNSRMNQWNAALGLWRRLFDREATAHNALQVATASVMTGNVAQGEQWMCTAKGLNQTTRDVPWMLIQTSYITALKNSGNATLAMPYLQEVKALYEDLHITDSTFLFLRGLPHFSSFLDNSRGVVINALSKVEVSEWYESMIPHIDSDGQTELKLWLKNGMPEIRQSTQ